MRIKSLLIVALFTMVAVAFHGCGAPPTKIEEPEGPAVVTSFSPDAVALAKRLEPGVKRGIISGSEGIPTVEHGIRLDCAMICLNEKLLEPDVVAAVRETNMMLCGWQGNTPEEMERQFAARVDGFSSDRPDVALEWVRGNVAQPVA